jgi:hypothetical protein
VSTLGLIAQPKREIRDCSRFCEAVADSLNKPAYERYPPLYGAAKPRATAIRLDQDLWQSRGTSSQML